MRSRVMPGSLVTMERRKPVKRLKSVDLPTLGRPRITRDGSWVVMKLSGDVALQCSAGLEEVMKQRSNEIRATEPRAVFRGQRPVIWDTNRAGEAPRTKMGRVGQTPFAGCLVESELRLRPQSRAPGGGASWFISWAVLACLRFR